MAFRAGMPPGSNVPMLRFNFQEDFLRQILAERFVQRGFAEKAGNVVIIQPDELVKCLPFCLLYAAWETKSGKG